MEILLPRMPIGTACLESTLAVHDNVYPGLAGTVTSNSEAPNTMCERECELGLEDKVFCRCTAIARFCHPLQRGVSWLPHCMLQSRHAVQYPPDANR